MPASNATDDSIDRELAAFHAEFDTYTFRELLQGYSDSAQDDFAMDDSTQNSEEDR